ncbi:uncharacterized protein [Haliotis cracherodii]|uniref:uncharacterized protein n=1 Tax=Haliotis cracherodii TaxID=6455 RepID=UPI0039EBFC9A
MCERFNRTLCNMLGTLDPDSKRNWKAHVGPLVHAYNCTRHESTELSPFFLMYGRHPRLPVDVAFGLDMEPSKSKSINKYTKELRERLSQAYNIASSAATKSRSKQKKYYDLKARAAVLALGDRVLVKVVAFDGRHKLANKWETDVYIVLAQPNPSIPVYTVGKECGEGRKRTLHRNLLLPIGSIPQPENQEPPIPQPRKVHPATPTPTARPRQRTLAPTVTIPVDEADADRPGSDCETESEDDYIAYLSHESSESSESAVFTADRPPEAAAVEENQNDEMTAVTEGDQEEDTGDAQEELPSGESLTHPEDPNSHSGVRSSTPPVPQPRRSNRQRTQPQWMTSGDYVLSAIAQPDWLTRANYLNTLRDTASFSDQSHRVSDAILDIVTGRIK